MSTPRTVLLTNIWLDQRGGTETVIRDIALGLLRRGVRPIVYSPHLGQPAIELHARGVAAISELRGLAEPPDMIHGQHLVQTGEALMAFPEAPAIQMCHSWTFWQEAPVRFPQVWRYVAVDEAVRDRLVHAEGIAPERVEVLLNAVDLSRLPERPEPPAARPRRALAVTKNKAQLPILKAACARAGIALEVLGAGGDREVAHPELELVKYDLVFATARMALEALCAGAAVVVCDSRGLAGLVTRETFARWRPLNFGLRCLTRAVSLPAIEAELAAYDAAEAAAVAEAARQDADLEPALDRLLALYGEAMDAPKPTAEARRAAELAWVHDLIPRMRTSRRWPWMAERDQLEARIAQLERALAAGEPRELAPLGGAGGQA
jgi:hypothetical protein